MLPQLCGSGHTAIASHGHCWGSVASYGDVVLLGNGRFPPKWRGSACLMAGICRDPENSPETIGVPVNPGGGFTPMRKGHDLVR